MPEISDLHYITQDHVKDFSHAQLAEVACQGGVKWVQLRTKNAYEKDWELHASQTQAVCKKYGAKFIINDNPTLAKALKADGVHLGKTDMDPAEAREILGKGFIIGGTANDFEDILRLADANVDYIGLGPFRFTQTKEKLSPVLGLEGYQKIMDQCRINNIHIPVIAIGGIKPEDINGILKTGIHGIAVASAINLAENKQESAARYIETLEKAALS
ncbi:thiamine phosphate synthase [Cytophagaceae bacterium ABcell3]|nr:thiamine phosphate synthase [Cytophagaceae bacterium ABcell3]